MTDLEFRKSWSERLKEVRIFENNVRSKRWHIIDTGEESNILIIGFDDEDDYIVTYADAIIKPTVLTLDQNNDTKVVDIMLEDGGKMSIPLNDVFICIDQVDTVEDEMEMYEIKVKELPAHLFNPDIMFPTFEVSICNMYDMETNLPTQLFNLDVYFSPADLLPTRYSSYKSLTALSNSANTLKEIAKKVPVLYKNGGYAFRALYDNDGNASYDFYETVDGKNKMGPIKMREVISDNEITCDLSTLLQMYGAENYVFMDKDSTLFLRDKFTENNVSAVNIFESTSDVDANKCIVNISSSIHEIKHALEPLGYAGSCLHPTTDALDIPCISQALEADATFKLYIITHFSFMMLRMDELMKHVKENNKDTSSIFIINNEKREIFSFNQSDIDAIKEVLNWIDYMFQ